MKKTRYIKFFVVAIVVILVIGGISLVSCEKGEYAKQTASVNYAKRNPLSNLNNPYDSVGLMHNNAMSALLCGSDGLPSSMREAIASAENYLYEQGFDTVGDYALVSKIIDDAEFNYFNFVSSQKISVVSIDVINSMLYDVASMSIGGNYSGYNSYRDYLIDVESKIIASDAIPSSEKDKLLMAAAVYRYSLYYWYNYFEKTKMPLWGKIAIIAGADAVGAAVAGGPGAVEASLAAAAVLATANEIDAKVDTTKQTVIYNIDL